MRGLSSVAGLIVALAFTAFSPLDYGVFRNESGRTVIVMLVDARGGRLKPHKLISHSSERFPVINGTAIVSDTSENVLSRCDLMPVKRQQEYYDFAKRTYYYRISGDGITPVLPKDARTWIHQ